jgi:hypothetical protein
MIENKNYNYLVLKIENEECLLEYEFNEDLEYLFSKWFGSINGFYDLVPLNYLKDSFKRGIYHFDSKLGDEKKTTIIINFRKFLNDEISYELFPFSTWRFIKQIVRDIRLNELID